MCTNRVNTNSDVMMIAQALVNNDPAAAGLFKLLDVNKQLSFDVYTQIAICWSIDTADQIMLYR